MDHYFVRYDSKSGDVLSHFVSSTNEITPMSRFAGEAVIEIKEEEHKKNLASFDPMSSRLQGRVDGGLLQMLKVEPIFAGRIALTCDRPDMDADGAPEVSADGASIARVTATLLGRDGKTLQRESARIRFQVTRGSLSRREIQAEKGTAQIELRAAAETVQARIVAQAEGFEQGTLVLEFIPPEEHRTLAAAYKKKEARK